LRAGTIIAFIVSLLVQVGYPLAAILHFRRRWQTPWSVFAYGALVFAIFQMFTWLPFSAYVDVAWGEQVTSAEGAFAWLVVMALLTALVEEGGRLLGYRFLFPRSELKLNWQNGVAFGMGHSAIETMWLIAGLTFVSFVAYLIAGPLIAEGPGETSAATLALLSAGSVTWTQPLVVAFERVLALPHQLAWALLVMESLASRQKRWFGFAVLYHTSVAILVPGLAQIAGFGVAEGVNAALAAVSLWIIRRMREFSEQRG